MHFVFTLRAFNILEKTDQIKDRIRLPRARLQTLLIIDIAVNTVVDGRVFLSGSVFFSDFFTQTTLY